MRRTILLFTSGVVGLLSGCARLDYVKVPTPTQYESWSDADQRKADKMKGVRYYLPRPFLVLKQSTPVAQRAAFISFHYNEKDECYVLDPPQSNPTWIQKIAPQKLSVTAALAATLAGQPNRGALGGVEKQAGTPTETAAAAASVLTNQPGGPNSVASANVPTDLHARTGFINDTDPVTRLGDRMDIVYLPDFEEQFVIEPTIGLGKADVETRLRNGWAAEVFSQQVDNSQLIPYIIDQVQKTSDAAASIFTTWAPVAAGLPPNVAAPLLKGLQKQGGKPGELDANAIRGVLGNVLLMKIAEVRIAQPGVYPILKPREIAHFFKTRTLNLGGDSEAAFDSFLKQASTPWVRPDMAFVPCPPFTVIGFNTTSDVFLSPATDRLMQTSDQGGASPGGTTGVSDQDKAAIVNKLKTQQALDKLGKLKDELNFDGIALSVDSVGKLQILVPVKGAAFQDADKSDQPVKDWVNTAFGSSAAVTKVDWQGTGVTAKVQVSTGIAPSAAAAGP